jgi:hypothetical protein
MLGVLVVVLRGDPVAGLGFGLGQRQISLIVSPRVVRAILLGAVGIRCPRL